MKKPCARGGDGVEVQVVAEWGFDASIVGGRMVIITLSFHSRFYIPPAPLFVAKKSYD